MKHKKKKPSRQKTGAARIVTDKMKDLAQYEEAESQNRRIGEAFIEIAATCGIDVQKHGFWFASRAIFKEVVITTILLAITLAGCLWKVGLIK